MKSHRFFRPAKSRSLLDCLFKAACLSRLLAIGWSQELPACGTGTQLFTVETTNEAAALANSLECANGSFAVEWFGVVIVAKTIAVAEGTSVSITGATADATVDGNNATQLFIVHGASSELLFKDMVLTNGRGHSGGAVHVLDQASVSFGGNTTFASNTASYGGAIWADFSSVVWDGEKTVFHNNSASSYGGAILAQSNSLVSGRGETVFTHNSAADRGGGIIITAGTNLSWHGNASFLDNSAHDGGAVVAQFSSILSWEGETVFANNDAGRWGGGVHLYAGSSVSWTGNTTFLNNSAHYRGGAVFAADSSQVEWGGNTTFTDNTAWRGGAVYANASSSVIWDGGDTAFSRNYASGYGGALMADSSSTASWSGRTVFVDNSAYYRGGAVFINESSTVFWSNATPSTAGNGDAGSPSDILGGEETTFINNTVLVNYGGAISAEFSSSVSWDGKTVFDGNYANLSGGAVCVRDNSEVSWNGETVFVNNDAPAWGGGLYVTGRSSVSWAGTTKFVSNHALDGGGLFIYDNSIGTWSGNTTFENNRVTHTGGALTVHRDSDASWTGETAFASNAADRGGAIFAWESSVSWAGNTTFSDNVALADGGAVYATAGSTLHCQGTTTFKNNSAAAGNGGALGIYAFGSTEGSYVSISGETTFTSNFALLNGGAMFSSANQRGQDFEGVVFRSNSAAIGGAVATFGTGHNDEPEASSPTTFSRCHFIGNTATETGGALETAFGKDEIISCHFENNSADIGGALRLGGATTIRDSSFVSNLASSRGLAVAAVGSVEIHGSSFRENAFLCRDGGYMHTDKKQFGTARYDSVCDGCPSWEDCQGCTVAEISSAPICSSAPEHTNANESGNTLETLSVDEGYWRATSTSDTILACFNPEACAGGQTGTKTFCSEGYSGAYCSVCESGYSPSMCSTCTRCSPSRRYWLEAFVVFTGVVVIWAMTVFSEHLVSSNFEERRTTCIHHWVLRWVPLQAFKSVIVVWQILTQFASVANVTYPGVYQAFLSGLDIFNLDVGFFISGTCLWSDSDFHDRLVAGTIWPLVILALLAMTYAIALRRNVAGDSRVLDQIRRKHLSAALLLLFFVYSSVSSIVFRMFACDSLDDGEEYLRADYRILCTGAKHRALQVYAGFMIAVYPVGIPLLFGVLLYRHREVLSDPSADKVAAQSISSLWAPYLPNRFYYEIVECARRIMLTGMVVFIYPNDTAQIAITIIFTFIFFVASEVLSPYESAFDAWVTRCGHVLIFFSMFDVLLLRVDVAQESSDSQKVLAGVLVVGHLVVIVAMVAEACALFLAAKRKRRVVLEEPTPSQRALRAPSIMFQHEQTESDYTFQGRNVLVS